MARFIIAQFDQIRFADQPQTMRHQPHAGNIAPIPATQILWNIDALVRQQTFGRILVILPDLLIQMQRRPPLAEQQVVEVANRKEIVVEGHASNSHTTRLAVTVGRFDAIVIDFTNRSFWRFANVVLERVGKVLLRAFGRSFDLYQIEQLVRVLVPKCGGVLEIDKANDSHSGTTGGGVVAEHVHQGEEEVVEVVVREARLRRERGRKVDVRAIEAVVHDVLATHRAVAGLFGFRAIRLLFHARDRTPRDGRVELQNTIQAFRECKLQRPANLSVEAAFERTFSRNHATEGSEIEERSTECVSHCPLIHIFDIDDSTCIGFGSASFWCFG